MSLTGSKSAEALSNLVICLRDGTVQVGFEDCSIRLIFLLPRAAHAEVLEVSAKTILDAIVSNHELQLSESTLLLMKHY